MPFSYLSSSGVFSIMGIESLPPEITDIICEQLPFECLHSVLCTCSGLYQSALKLLWKHVNFSVHGVVGKTVSMNRIRLYEANRSGSTLFPVEGKYYMPHTCSDFMSWDCSCVPGCVTLDDTSLPQLVKLAAMRGPENMPFCYIETLYLNLSNPYIWTDTFRHFHEYDVISWDMQSWETTFNEMIVSRRYYIPYIIGLKLIPRYSPKLSEIRILVGFPRESFYSYPEYVQFLQALCQTFPRACVCLNFGLIQAELPFLWDTMSPVLKLENVKELNMGAIKRDAFWEDLLYLSLDMPLLETFRANFNEWHLSEYHELSKFLKQFPRLQHLFIPGMFSVDLTWGWLPEQIQTLKLGMEDYDDYDEYDYEPYESDSDQDRPFRTYAKVTDLVYDGGMVNAKFDVEFPNVKHLQLGKAHQIYDLEKLILPCSRTLSTLALHGSTYDSVCGCLGLVDSLEILVVSKVADSRGDDWHYVEEMIPDLIRIKIKCLYLDFSPFRTVSITDALKCLTGRLDHLEQLYFEVPEQDVPALEALGMDKRLSTFCGVCNFPSTNRHHRGLAIAKSYRRG
uniref:ARAD1A08866p n=1 Tax=Blastobotrys adeninivorans TaxID=409370 RepID=A0A060SY15_BLAAD